MTSTWLEGAFYSNDGGGSWKKISSGITQDTQANEFEVPHFSNLRISNKFNEDKTAFLGGFNGLFKSTDGGRIWREIDTLSDETIVALAVSPNYVNDSTVVVVPYVGFPHMSNDGGTTWRTLYKGLELPRFTRNLEKVNANKDPRRFFDIAFSPNYSSDDTLFATILWTKFINSTNNGESWKLIQLSKEVRGITIVPSPDFASDKTIYLGNQQGIIYKSTDGGKSFSVVGSVDPRKSNDPPSLVISPDFSSDRTLYSSGLEGVYKTVNGGKTWQSITKGSDLMARNRIQLAISPNYQVDKTVLVGTDRGLFKTTDSGENWVKLAGSAYGGESYVESLAISPDYQNDHTFIVSVRGQGLFKTINGGETFTQTGDDSISLSGIHNVPSAYKSIVFSPSYALDKTIYGFGSSEAEVFKSTDGGGVWKALALPEHENSQYDQYNLMTLISLSSYVYQGHFIRVLAALLAAISSYFLLGYLGLERKIPFGKSQIKVVGTFVVFVSSLALLFS